MILKNHKKVYICWLPVGLAILLFSSCGVSSRYQRPENIAGKELYRGVENADSSSLADIPWEEMFPDPLLRTLISEALENNSDLQIALARIKAAEAVFKQSRLALLPSLELDGSATYQQTGLDNPVRSENYQLYGSAAWELDIWGKLRSTKRANMASLLESRAYKRAVQTQLIADVATAYYTLLAYDEQLRITESTLEKRIESVETMKVLKENNVVTGAGLVQSEASRYSTELTIPPLRQSIFEAENALCALLGRNPGPVERSTLAEQQIVSKLRTGVPAMLLANRPDVQEAEFRLMYYGEMVNVARAYFYPSLSLTAQGGLSDSDLSEYFDPVNVFANLAGGLAQPLFNQGANRKRLQTARANQEEYLIAFRQTLLEAGVEVSAALYDYQTATEKIELRKQQIYFLEKSVDYTRELMKFTSSTNYTDVLTSEQSLLSAELSSVSDTLAQLQAVVDLYRSLGGGWKENN